MMSLYDTAKVFFFPEKFADMIWCDFCLTAGLHRIMAPKARMRKRDSNYKDILDDLDAYLEVGSLDGTLFGFCLATTSFPLLERVPTGTNK